MYYMNIKQNAVSDQMLPVESVSFTPVAACTQQMFPK